MWLPDPDQPKSHTSADSGKRAAADFPGVDLEVVKAMLGPEICSKASNGSKQFTVRAAGIADIAAQFLVAEMTLAAMRVQEYGPICASHSCVMTRRRLELVDRSTCVASASMHHQSLLLPALVPFASAAGLQPHRCNLVCKLSEAASAAQCLVLLH